MAMNKSFRKGDQRRAKRADEALTEAKKRQKEQDNDDNAD
jgi:hypothetical protein